MGNVHPWLASSDLLSIFPTPVWRFELAAEVREALNARIAALLAELRPPAAAPQWQSPHELHRRNELAALVACIDAAVRSILAFLRIGYQAWEITGCWANVNAPGAAHRQHSHPNNFLSGVYYVQTPAGADTINFHDPRVQTGVIRPPVTELTAANADQVVVRVSSGTLLLFPAYLPHSVEANASGAERISISFNVMFSAFAENLAKPMW